MSQRDNETPPSNPNTPSEMLEAVIAPLGRVRQPISMAVSESRLANVSRQKTVS